MDGINLDQPSYRCLFQTRPTFILSGMFEQDITKLTFGKYK